jgi:hypothetical protein
MSESPSADEVFQKIDDGSSAWQDIIPFEEHDRFVEGVKQAVQIYLSLVSPKDLRDELIAFEKATRSPSAPINQLVSGLSPGAQDILSHSGSLPLPPDDPAALEAYYNDIRSRLLRSQRWKPEGSKRRKQTKIVGPPKRMGRPPDTKIDALVSFMSAAYAYAVGKPATRSWSEENESAVERIVEDVFANLGIDADYSARKAVRRHIERRGG